MGQVTIYLDSDIEQKMRSAEESSQLSVSKWIANIIREKVSSKCSQEVIDLAGRWNDFPSLEEIRSQTGTDVKREEF